MSESSSESDSTPVRKRSAMLIVFVVVFIDLLGFGIVLPLLPRYGAVFQAGKLQIGLLMAAFSAMQFLFAPAWGALSDRIGRRPVLILGLIGSTVSYAMFGVATALGRDGMLLGLGAIPWLFITRMGAGIAGATIATAQAVIADSTGSRDRGKGMALVGAAFGIGFTFGPLIGAFCASPYPTVALNDEQYAWVSDATPESISALDASGLIAELESRGPVEQADQTGIQRINEQVTAGDNRTEVKAILLAPPSALPGYVAAGISFVALLMAIVLLPESNPVVVGTLETSGTAARQPRRRGWRQLAMLPQHIADSRFRILLPTIFVTTFAFAQFESTLSLLTREFGYSSSDNFWIFAFIGFVLMLSQGLLVRRLIPRIGEHRTAVLGVTLMSAGLVLIALTADKILPQNVLTAVIPISVVGFSCVTPSLQSLLSRATAADQQGAVLGSGQSLSSLARILGPPVGIGLLALTPGVPYYSGAALIALSGFLVLRIPTPDLPKADDAAEGA